jgi:large subunit ribosomal protein L23
MSKMPAEIVYGPVISERSYALAQAGRYTFRVAPAATKPDIARAIEEHYSGQEIKVTAVNTLKVRGKRKRLGFRGPTGSTPRWKKAIVTLAPGQSLPDLFGSL